MTPWLAGRARETPRAPALETSAGTITFADLAERSDLVARRLAGRGVRRGDRVALLGEPTPRSVEIVHALQRLGATLVPIGTRLAEPEVRRLLDFVRPRLTLHDARRAHLVAAESIEMQAALDATDLAPASVLRDEVAGDDVHSIVFTSGTTGTPKGAMLTHRGHHASAVASAARLGTTAADRWLLCMSLAHVGGLSIVLRSAITGFAIVLHDGFDAGAAARALREGGVTTVSVVATKLYRLLEVAPGRSWPETLRCVLTGGGPLPASLLARALALGVPVAPTYGLTEACSQVATAPPGSVGPDAPVAGAPLPGVDVCIADAGADGVGEILVRGPIVMAGYFDNAEASARALRDGWLHTGDLGRLDEAGRLQVAGRCSDLIVSGGENVTPDEVEEVLRRHPAVADAAVYGVPDDHWGERVLATVVPAGAADFDEQALRAWCREHLAGFKVPAAIRAVATLPRTPSGKVQRHRLA
jgi:O-succinylbenzoic acid--CoA ligase